MVPDINRRIVERLIHEYVNDARVNHGLSKLSHDPELVIIARDHCEDMADNDFFAHETPEGNTFEDRYADAEYDCRVPAGEARYLGGAENIAKTYAGVPLENGEYHNSESDVATSVVNDWLESPDHRENILTEHWNQEGIGSFLKKEGEPLGVYVTQNFC